jgi:hypothetical protein
MTKKNSTLRLVTLTLWHNELPDYTGPTKPVTINPAEVSDIEDWGGIIRPGQKITLKNKKMFVVMGTHADIVAKLTAKEGET